MDGTRAQPGSLRIAAWPAFAKEGENPYTANFARALQQRGHEVVELDLRTVLRSHDAVIVHWPEAGLYRPQLTVRVAAAVVTLAGLGYQRARGARIVWVTHNLRPHRNRSPRLTQAFYGLWTRLVDGYLNPSAESRSVVVEHHPGLASLPSATIPHGPYEVPIAVDPLIAEETADRFRIGDDELVVLWFGKIRGYKGVPELVEAFRATEVEGVRLVVAGGETDEGGGDELVQLAGEDPRITIRLGHVPDDTLNALLHRAQLVVTPYRTVLNSGSVIHSLSAGVPVLCPRVGALAALADQVGDGWFRTMRRPLDAPQLEQAIDWVCTRHVDGRPQIGLSWPDTAEATEALIRELVARS